MIYKPPPHKLYRTMLQDVTTGRQQARVPQILEAEIQVKTHIQIAEDLGVSLMQIWRDRQTPLYDTIKNEFLDLYINKVKELLHNEKVSVSQRASEEMGRFLRAGVTKSIHQRTEKAEIKIHLHDFTPKPKETEPQ